MVRPDVQSGRRKAAPQSRRGVIGVRPASTVAPRSPHPHRPAVPSRKVVVQDRGFDKAAAGPAAHPHQRLDDGQVRRQAREQHRPRRVAGPAGDEQRPCGIVRDLRPVQDRKRLGLAGVARHAGRLDFLPGPSKPRPTRLIRRGLASRRGCPQWQAARGLAGAAGGPAVPNMARRAAGRGRQAGDALGPRTATACIPPQAAVHG